MTEYKIFPAIGIARVGNSKKSFYIGPEAYRGLPINPDGREFTENDFRDGNSSSCCCDSDGALRRQAARFRIYRIENGKAEEITLQTHGVKAITWNVHLANKKASWYTFQPSEGEGGYAPNHPLRNPQVKDRRKLIIDAGPRQIAGSNQSGVHFNMDSVPPDYQGAHFPEGNLNPLGKPIATLGELQTDREGRLLVLGGYGVSGTTDTEVHLDDYANNDNWWDDTSDGPVGACITLNNGQVIEVASAHVLVCPPKYAPQLANLVTLYDTIFDAMVRSNHYPEIFNNGFWHSGKDGYKPNFRTDIQPLLERASLYPWVTAIPPKPHRFDFDKLGATNGGQGAPEFQGLRRYLLDFVRPPYQENILIADNGATLMPYLAGDNCLVPGTATSTYMRLTDTQYFFLQQWADGWFVNHEAEDNPAQALTRAVLDNCVGGPFSPGIEMSWISRDPAIYAEPFRIRARFVPQGPLSLDFDPQRGMEPGDITRYMAVPWQADFNECSSQSIGERTLWWWPAQRPEFVYLEPKPKLLGAVPQPDEKSGLQVPWIGTDFDQMSDDFIGFADNVQMVQYWDQLGFVMGKDIDGEQRYVEVARALPRPFSPSAKGCKG